MPILDRHWWLRVLLACGASAIALAYVVWCVRTGLSIPPDSPYSPGLGVLFFALLILMLLFHLAHYAVVSALPARRRALLAAIREEGDMAPVSLIVPHPERAPDVAAEPLIVAWRPLTFRRSETAPLWAVLVLGLGLLLLLIFFQSLAYAIASYHSFPEIFLHTALSAILITLLIIAFLVILVFIISVWPVVTFSGVASPIIAFFAKPFDVMADVEGVTAHNSRGREHRVRWDDARLLEVTIAPPVLGGYRVFTLYGRDSYARWRDDTGADVQSPLPLDGITREEGVERLQSLLDLIAARTGLMPRTFDGTLVAERRRHLPPLLRRSLRLLKQALVCATLATVSMLFPPVNAGMLTFLPSAMYFLLAAGCLVFIPIYRRRPPAAVRQDTLPHVEGAIADQDAQHTYAVYTFIARSQALAGFVVSLLIFLAALPLLFAWFGTLDIPVLHMFHAVQFSPLWPAQAAAVLVGFLGVVGLLVGAVAGAVFFSQAGSLAVQADAEGMRDRRGAKDATLAWDAVDVITRSTDDEREIGYTVAGNYARTIIRWSTRNALPPNPALPLPSVTPEQFAAIVVARSGKQLTIR